MKYLYKIEFCSIGFSLRIFREINAAVNKQIVIHCTYIATGSSTTNPAKVTAVFS